MSRGTCMTHIHLEEPNEKDETRFLSMANQSKQFHESWVNTPLTIEEFNHYLQRYTKDNQKSYWVYCDQDIVGVFNLSEIIRGYFQSAYLGFYAFEQYAGKGLMSQGLKLLLRKAFTELNLHRIETNIQPANHTSKQLVKRNGFKKEGFSPRYLKINDQWRDHERWAITVEDWRDKNNDNQIKLDPKVKIRLMTQSDISEIVSAFKNCGWNKPATLFQGYLKDQENKERTVWCAYINDSFAGYVTLNLNSAYLPFKEQKIPEINDLNVLPHYRNKGIGTQLLDIAEKQAAKISSRVGIGVGLYPDYGQAQRLYVKRGYMPDGKGITYQHQAVVPGQAYCVDDDLNLWFTKDFPT